MNEFESTNLVPATVAPYGTPDQLDVWYSDQEYSTAYELDDTMECGCSEGMCYCDESATYDEEGPYLSDVDADAMTLAGAGWGTDEDYGLYGGEDYDAPPF